jgi:deoxyribose-phosphate aldolase
VRLASELAGESLKVCSVIGFPLGLNAKEVKVHEAVRAVSDGAQELDMVMNLSAFKSGNYSFVEEEIKAVKRESGVLLKVIIETCYLTDEEKVKAVKIVLNSGAEFVKTSTGFGKGGATVDDIKLLKEAGEGVLKVKAAGGIKDYRTAIAMIEAGADRLGTSSGFEIYKESRGV